MLTLIVMDDLQASLSDVAQAPSSKLPGFLSEIRPLFMYAYSADPNSGEILVGPRHSVENTHAVYDTASHPRIRTSVQARA
jgi:hypothetical protein